ncbi:MAG: TonB-dependent hemoglobin/transferrin/lactoferrin family receptor [Alcaligenaceae bacterium]|nr:TonB-dependent hemoglobin/transferrin/lactoferrin family receptor [Alcaligenaceae bacterium]
MPVIQAQDGNEVKPRENNIGRQELERADIQSWADLGQRLVPGVNFSRTDSSVNIRGVGGHRVLLTEDGVPMPWLSDGSRGVKGGLESINFNTLSAIDIVKGPGSKQSSAMAGVVALSSLSPGDLLSGENNIGFLAKTAYSGLDDSISGDIAFAARLSESTRMLLQYGYKKGHEIENIADVGGYGTGRTKANPADYHRNSALFRLEHDLAPGHKLGFGASFFRQEKDIDQLNDQDNATYKIGDNALEEIIKRDRVWLNYDYQSQQAFSSLDSLSVLAYWNKTALEDNQDAWRQTDARAYIIPRDPYKYGYPSGEYTRYNNVEQKGWGLNLDASGYWSTGELRSQWRAGIGFAEDRYRQYSGGVDNCPVVPPGLPAPFGPRACEFLHTNQADVPSVKSRDWSAYVQNTFSWANGQYSLTPGIRYDHYQRNPQTSSAFANNENLNQDELGKRSGGRFSPSLEFNWNPTETVNLFARYAHGFRAPTAPELYMQFGSVSNYLRKGDPGLAPESSRGWELSVSVNTDTAGAALTVFDQRYKNFIESGIPVSPDSVYGQMMQTGMYPFGVFSYTNLERVRIYGLEASAYWNINSNWYTRGSVAWANGKDRATGQHLNSVAPVKGILALGYQTAEWGGEAILTLAAKRNKVMYPEATAENPNPDFKAPGYGTLDLSVYWTPSMVKGLRVQAGLMNVFDKKYWNALNVPTAGSSRISREMDYYTEPGRHASISVSYQY